MIDGGKQESFKREIYVGAKNEIARKLAEKAYLEKVIACGDNTIKCLEALTKDNKALRDEALDLCPNRFGPLFHMRKNRKNLLTDGKGV